EWKWKRDRAGCSRPNVEPDMCRRRCEGGRNHVLLTPRVPAHQSEPRLSPASLVAAAHQVEPLTLEETFLTLPSPMATMITVPCGVLARPPSQMAVPPEY